MTARRGFTLIETMISIAILAILLATTAPVLGSLYHRNDVDLATAAFVSSARRAQTLATAGANDGPWGVYVNATSVTVFQGATYAARKVSEDELTPFDTTLTATGTTQLSFAEMTGTTTPATTTLVSGAGDTRTITINAYGTVSY